MARSPLYFVAVVEAGIETGHRSSILPARSRMKKIGSILLAGFFLFIAPVQLRSQSDDPSETFLKAYMTAQQGEKLEHEGQFGAALAKYRFAGSLLEQLRKTHGDWQSAIVEYRSRKVSENILRVQGKVSTQEDLSAGPTPLPDAAPVLPQQPGGAEPSVEIATPRGNEPAAAPTPRPGREQKKPAPPAATPNDAALREATKKLQSRVDQLQAELRKSRDKFGDIEKEKEALNTQLKESTSKLEKAQGELEKSMGAEKKVREQLADAQQSLKKVQSATGADPKAQESLRAEIGQLK